MMFHLHDAEIANKLYDVDCTLTFTAPTHYNIWSQSKPWSQRI